MSDAAVLSFPPLSVLHAQVRYRMNEATSLPPYKGAMLRGGFGYAFQRAACAPPCWGRVEHCTATLLCPYRWVFETPHPEGVAQLHDLQDVPRPFVIEPPRDHQRAYAVGDPLDFGLVLIGRGIDFLPYFLHGFAQLGTTGLGRDLAKAQLELVTVQSPLPQPDAAPASREQPEATAIYAAGRIMAGTDLPILNLAEVLVHAATLPADLRLELVTPLRVKAKGAFIEQIDLGAIVQAICWRINALTTFHGQGPWRSDYRPLVAAARAVRLERAEVRWVDWERTSTRGGNPRQMKLGGLIGSATLREVPLEVRAALLAASLLHVGKACVFGHGWLQVSHL